MNSVHCNDDNSINFIIKKFIFSFRTGFILELIYRTLIVRYNYGDA